MLNHVPGAEPGFDYQYADRQRRPVLLAAAVLFALAVVVLGRLRGLAALGGIAVSLVVILQFVLPAILDGHGAVPVAVLGSAAIAYVALYLAHGFSMMTTVALLGTLASLALTVVLSAIFTALGEFSGYASEEAVLLQQLAGGVDVSGLVLGGIVIGALGALDDVTVTQVSAVAELRRANPAMPPGALYRSGLRIGRDHIASTVNTLALAYAGAALPVMLLFVLSQQSLGTVANSEVVATEIVRALVGSVGLVASVPITTWLAARVVAGGAPPARPGPCRPRAARRRRRCRPRGTARRPRRDRPTTRASAASGRDGRAAGAGSARDDRARAGPPPDARGERGERVDGDARAHDRTAGRELPPAGGGEPGDDRRDADAGRGDHGPERTTGRTAGSPRPGAPSAPRPGARRPRASRRRW
ncbi:MAG: hypothetical protein KatS3mg009_0276 [Acidimicrobiia bacterium]|nr:MAG: hypothetical protein KatS3mg009_0276 [Acidimicrobiia bacterium]